jgi:translation initiation factor IF-3
LITDELMNRQITVVISSHNLRELEDICDSIALLDHNTISIQDEVENIRSNYHKLQIGKFKFEQEKKKKEQKKKQVAAKLKEVKFHVNIGDHDYQTKLRHTHDFIDGGDRVKVSLMFRGRENAHRELGFELMKRIIADCAEIAAIEQAPRLMGRNIFMMIVPKKTK